MNSYYFLKTTSCGRWLIYANYSLRETEQLNLKTTLSSKVNRFEGEGFIPDK